MNVLVLTKRQYMNKDLLDDRFGRFYELPFGLANRGHRVRGVCLSYSNKSEGETALGANIRWHSINAGVTKLPGLFRFAKTVEHLIRQDRPDIIWSGSDSIYGILGSYIARKNHIKSVIDLYDNFDTYQSARIPGVLRAFYRAVRESDGITAFSRPMLSRLEQEIRPKGKLALIEFGVDPNVFIPQDRNESRQALGLPADALIIGYTGAISGSRGIHVLFDGFQQLRSEFPNLYLVLAGASDPRVTIPADARIRHLGMLPQGKVPLVINAADVNVICNRNSPFGSYSFPQKAYEIIACRKPLVVADTGSMSQLFGSQTDCLYEPENTTDFVRALRFQLMNPTVALLPVLLWDDLAGRLEAFLTEL